MRKLFPIMVLLTVLFAGCASLGGVDISQSPEVPYYIALRAFNGAWESYHKVWSQLPEATKTEWVNKYHKIFEEATIFLDAWSLDPTNPDPVYDGRTWRIVADHIEDLLIQLAIRKQ